MIAFQRNTKLPWRQILVVNKGDMQDYFRVAQKILMSLRPALPASSS
jgi:hypothetical protein